ncbi:LacI family DNA-binding transcriptional regulator [Flavihumibacter sp. UBA7668]|uniref:LacI family DNA-binding transcriptional regulator n=1 Tax=Flavihumibacter sp. UBA7668 TaxID=1946542 RepID=UPI0025C5E849|nr:LacI family DNA-binding transcriptional regulator [Flavihumibacter sp. UBA7668]
MAEDKEITIYDIAKHLNLSAATVSRGLKGSPLINKHTRKKINEAAKELGYRSNSFASNLRSKQSHTLGVLTPRLNSHFVSAALAGMEDVASREGYRLIITQSLEDVEKEKINVQSMFNNRVDGLLVSLAANTENLDHFEPFFNRKIPVVFFDRVVPHPDSTSVVIDNYTAAYNITQHLIEQGCTKILHLGGNLLRNVYSDRLKGFKQALKEHDLPLPAKFHQISNLSSEAGTQAADWILSLPADKRPDAVFSANDTAAVFCMLRLKAAGIKIPDDIAFAGFNNDPISVVIEPNLTTVDYSGYNIGQTAAKNLINHLKGSIDIYMTDIISLRSDLIIRGSSLRRSTDG